MKHKDFQVGWICALPTELAAAVTVLDEQYEVLPQPLADHNVYTLGRIGQHNVVIACLPAGMMGLTSAARVALQMRSTFSSITIGLMVGIGGGAPSEDHDIRLGDVVVSKPSSGYGGVVQYDYGKTIEEGRFIATGHLNRPPDILLNAVTTLQARHMYRDSSISEILQSCSSRYPRRVAACTYPGTVHDLLFDPSYEHVVESRNCVKCEREYTKFREPRENDYAIVHYGLIASANQVMRNGTMREKLRKEFDVLCFEMEAAGLMDDFPCLVIRGICDYSDSHKNKLWQDYAAATATGYAKELLLVIPTAEVAVTGIQSQSREGYLGIGMAPSTCKDTLYPLSRDSSEIRFENQPGNKSPVNESEKVYLVIGIYLGQAFTSVSFDWGPSFRQACTIGNWPGATSQRHLKVPSILKYYDGTNFVWGYEVGQMSYGIEEPIKVLMDGETALHINTVRKVSHLDGQKILKTEIEVVADYLGKVCKHALEKIASGFPSDWSEAVQKRFVCTVPTVFSDRAKHALILATRIAKIHPVKLISGVEATTKYSLRLLPDKTVSDGDVVIACNVGYSGIELVSYKVVDHRLLQMTEVVPPTGYSADSFVGIHDLIHSGRKSGLSIITTKLERSLSAIVDLVSDQIKVLQDFGTVKAILLVGELGSIPALQKAISPCFRKITVFQPSDTYSYGSLGAVLSELS